jgi:hypothetical protein
LRIKKQPKPTENNHALVHKTGLPTDNLHFNANLLGQSEV